MQRSFDPYAYGNPINKGPRLRSALTQVTGTNGPEPPASYDAQKNRSSGLVNLNATAAISTKENTPLTHDTSSKNGSNDLQHSEQLGLLESKFAPDSSVHTSKTTDSRTIKSFTQSSLVAMSCNQDRGSTGRVDTQQTSDQPRSSKLELDHQRNLSAQFYTAPATSTDSSISQGRTNGALVVTEPKKHETPATNMPFTSRTTSSRSQILPQINLENNNHLSTEEKVHQARAAALKRIQLRSRAKEKTATTSLRDLDIARTPIQPDVQTPDTATNNVRPPAESLCLDNASNQYADAPSFDKNTNMAIDPQKQLNTWSKRKSSKHRWESSKPNATQTAIVQVTKNTRWADKADLKPVEVDVDSNAWGSSIPSNASQASNDSLQPLHSGKALRKHAPPLGLHPLAEWDGTMQPPPVDWNERPRFDNYNSPEFHDEFARWLEDVFQLTIEANNSSVVPVSTTVLEDVQNTPDGLSMVPRNTTVNKTILQLYGYQETEITELLKYVQPLQPTDFHDWGRLDLRRPENMAVKNETTGDLVSNWVKQREARRKVEYALMEQQEQAAHALFDYKPAPNPNRPKVNIYLRPAISDDVPQMTSIYNWYIEHTPRPAEIYAIDEGEMQGRLDDTRSSKLPFIVAIERSGDARSSQDHPTSAKKRRGNQHGPNHEDPLEDAKFAMEKIVGWACAQDFTATDFVERVSVELEVYTDPAYRQLGIGRCLLDKLIESCDRGYMKRGGYPFHCPSEKTHLYSGGGGRDLIKLVFILRKWKHPKNADPRVKNQKDVKLNPKRKPDDRENDYDAWIKNWLETWGFEVEGILKGAGAKHGRFVDLVHFGRETSWHPAEGRIPDPIPSI